MVVPPINHHRPSDAKRQEPMDGLSDLLVITASSRENLRMAEQIAAVARERELVVELLDLTLVPLPLYNPRHHAAAGIPEAVSGLHRQLEAAPRWLICAPEYNGSIPPVLSSAIAWLSVQGEDFRALFQGRPIALATHSGGPGLEMLAALRIQLAHLGATVVGRQLRTSGGNPLPEASINNVLEQLISLNL
jgi:NAD(P)H-dependent FMN reductase